MLPVVLHGIHEGHLLGGGGEFLGTREGPKLLAVELSIVVYREAACGFHGFEDGIERGL